VAGEPPYPAEGYEEVSREVLKVENGSDNLVIIMEKGL
jgi:hypothetical protein